ncbi:MAG: nucleotidyltransferase domain-containing protein [Candidatus Bathyarchaeia archaeon]
MKVRLKGNNQIRLFRQVGKRLVSKITVSKNVAGVIFLGGLARGFADKYSDVDIIVLLNKEDQPLRRQIHNMGLEERKNSGLDIDLEIHYLNAFQRWKWDETNRWDFSHAEIVHDPEGQITRLFDARLKVSEKFWVKRIVTCTEYMKWYCCPPTDDVGTIAEAWVDRGDLLSANYCLNYAIDLLLKTVFALNKEFLPPPKWRLFYFRNLNWLPSNYGFLKAAIEVKGLTVECLNRRLKSLREIWQVILVKVQEETGLRSDNQALR